MTTIAVDKPVSYAGFRFPPEVISYAVWLQGDCMKVLLDKGARTLVLNRS